MHCCNHNCNQGRACPARSKQYVKHDGSDPLRGPVWSRNLRKDARAMLIASAFSVGFVAAIAAYRLIT